MVTRPFAVATLLALASGCGYVGDPQPPALFIPRTIEDLRVTQRGGKLIAVFTPPTLTTEGLPLTPGGSIDMRIGPFQGEFQTDAWAAAAKAVTAVNNEVEIDVSEFAGREVFVGVRTAGPRGRWSGWSNVEAVRVVAALPKPDNLKAEATAEGVRLSWTAVPPARVAYRILRQAEKEESFSVLDRRAAQPFVDKTAEFEREYRYQVIAILPDGTREAESAASDVVTITPLDRFAPAVPRGVNVIVGVASLALAWERNTETDFRHYRVYRAEGEGALEKIAEGVESPAFTDNKVESGKTYRYSISSVDQKGNESGKSEPVTASIPQ